MRDKPAVPATETNKRERSEASVRLAEQKLQQANQALQGVKGTQQQAIADVATAKNRLQELEARAEQARLQEKVAEKKADSAWSREGNASMRSYRAGKPVHAADADASTSKYLENRGNKSRASRGFTEIDVTGQKQKQKDTEHSQRAEYKSAQAEATQARAEAEGAAGVLAQAQAERKQIEAELVQAKQAVEQAEAKLPQAEAGVTQAELDQTMAVQSLDTMTHVHKLFYGSAPQSTSSQNTGQSSAPGWAHNGATNQNRQDAQQQADASNDDSHQKPH